jgi:DNA-binding MarR family transcriptional regulator
MNRGLRRPGTADYDDVTLGSRHSSVLALVRDGEIAVGTVAQSLDLNLTTASGLIADLERAGLLQRSIDPADRRRTVVAIKSDQQARVNAWIEGATAPIERALQQLSSDERAAFVKAMALLDAELNPCTGLVCPTRRPATVQASFGIDWLTATWLLLRSDVGPVQSVHASLGARQRKAAERGRDGVVRRARVREYEHDRGR